MTFAGVDPLLILIGGLALDALFGDMPAIFRYVSHPVVIAGRAIASSIARLAAKPRAANAASSRSSRWSAARRCSERWSSGYAEAACPALRWKPS
jgi:hypothetical protein